MRESWDKSKALSLCRTWENNRIPVGFAFVSGASGFTLKFLGGAIAVEDSRVWITGESEYSVITIDFEDKNFEHEAIGKLPENLDPKGDIRIGQMLYLRHPSEKASIRIFEILDR